VKGLRAINFNFEAFGLFRIAIPVEQYPDSI